MEAGEVNARPVLSAGRTTWAALLLVVLLAVAGYGFLWAPGKVPYSPYSDFLAEHLSTKQVLYDSLRQGRGIPFWRSDQFSGYGGLTNPQALFTYPLHFLFYLLPPLAAAGPTFWLHFLAAGVAFYLVGAALGLGVWPRLFMATAGLFSFKLLAATYAGWLPIVPGIACFPLLFAAVFYLVRRPGPTGGLALAGAGALCLHTGHLQLFYYSACFLAAYLLTRLPGWLRLGERRNLVRTGGWLVVGTALAAGLAAYLLLPLAAEYSLISRSQTSYEFFLAGHALGPRHLLTFLYPQALGTPLDGSYPGAELWEDVGYFGLVPLALAALGVGLAWRRHPARFLAAGFLAAVLLTMDTPLLRLLYQVLPGFRLFRCPARLLFVAAFFGVALAGLGLEEVLTRLRARGGRPYLPGVLAGGLIAIVAVEGTVYARRYLVMVPHSQAVPDTAYRRFLSQDRTVFRLAPAGRSTLNYGWAASMGLQLAAGYDSYNYRSYQTYMDLLQWGDVRRATPGPWCDLNEIFRGDLLDALNVKYLLTSQPLEFTHGRFAQVAVFEDQPVFVFYTGMTRKTLYLYRNAQSAGRAFWADQVETVAREDQIIPKMRALDLRTAAVVLSGEPLPVPPSAPPGGQVEVLEVRPGHLLLQTASDRPRLLVISEVWHSGWRARLDGQRLPLYRANYALLGAVVPGGKHDLEMDFRPLHWPLALAITAGAGAALLVLAAVHLARRGRRKIAAPGG